MAEAAKKASSEPNPHAIARESLEEARKVAIGDGVWARAREIMAGKVAEDEALQARLIEIGIQHCIMQATRNERGAYFRNGSGGQNRSGTPVRSASGANSQDPGQIESDTRSRAARASSNSKAAIRRMAKRNLMDFPLIGGLRLGDATREALVSQIEHHEHNATENAKRAVWFGAVVKKLKKDRTVSESMTEADLGKLALQAGMNV